MQMLYLFGIIFFLSCKSGTPLEESISDNKAINIQLDFKSPEIEWLSPRFDALIETIVKLQLEVQDSSEIFRLDLYVDSLQLNLEPIATSDTTWKFNWQTVDYSDGDEVLLFVKATDIFGNDTTSNILRVIIDNKYVHPDPIFLYPLDSLIVDAVILGHDLKWWYSGDKYFQKYMVKKSYSSLMIDAIELFSTSDKSNVRYNDLDIIPSEIVYYQVIVEDIFGKMTKGNVVTNSNYSIPPQFNIQSVNYNAHSVFIEWDKIVYDKYLTHKILFSDKRDGDYQVLQEYTDPSEVKYEGPFTPSENNWFAIQAEDSLGQVSIGQPYIHPIPQEPFIDSVLYNGEAFRLHWNIEPDIDFSQYSILFSEDEDPFNLNSILTIKSQIQDTIFHNCEQSQYYLYQIITSDVWGLKNKGPIIRVSSFIKFSKNVDTGSSEILSSIILDDDGDYIALGESYSGINWLALFNKFGDLENTSNLIGTNYKLNSIIKSKDGGTFITGYNVVSNRENLLLIKTDKSGNEEWTKIIKHESNISGNSLIELSDGNIALVGNSNSNNNQNMIVLKLDSQGNELWNKVIGGSKSEAGYDILESPNGDGVTVLGTTFSNGDDDGDIWLIKLNSQGAILDTIIASIPGKQIGYSFAQSELNEFVIGGITSSENSGVTDAIIIKINIFDEIQWQYTYGGIYNDLGKSLIASDDGWVLVGQTYSYGKGMGDVLLIKVNDFGELDWVQTIGGPKQDSAFDIKLALDKGFIIAGSTFIKNNRDGWLVKTDSRGNVKQMLPYNGK